MKICPFDDPPTERQIKFAEHIQSFVGGDENIKNMSKKEITKYINKEKPRAEEIIDEVSYHTDIY